MVEEEKVFLQEPGILITNARLVFGNKTYAMASVNSIQLESQALPQASKLFLLFISLTVGFCWLFPSVIFLIISWTTGGFISTCLSLGICALSIYKYSNRDEQRFIYKILLRVSSGEIEAFVTKVGKLALRVEDAISQSLVYRG